MTVDNRRRRCHQQQRKCQLWQISTVAVANGKTGRKRISDIFKTCRRMCVDGPEDRGSIVKYGSPERMPVLSRKERTLPMRSLPAAFAVSRIPPLLNPSRVANRICTGEHSAADVCLHLKVRPISPERRPACPQLRPRPHFSVRDRTSLRSRFPDLVIRSGKTLSRFLKP